MIRRCNSMMVIGLLLVIVVLCGQRPAVAARGGDFAEINPFPLSIIDDPDPTGFRDTRLRTRADGTADRRYEWTETGAPSILFVPEEGETLVARTRRGTDGSDIVLLRGSDGRWSEPVVVAGSPLDELDPWLALDPQDGSVHLVYWVRGETPAVVHRRVAADRSVASEPRFVSPPGEIAVRPSATVRDGRLWVAYESLGTSRGAMPKLIVLAGSTADGFADGQVVGVSHHRGAARPFVTTDSDGRLRVEWTDRDGEIVERRGVGGR
jgi:hypothetical protein